MARQIQTLPQPHVWVPRNQPITPVTPEDRFAGFRSHLAVLIPQTINNVSAQVSPVEISGSWPAGFGHGMKVYAYRTPAGASGRVYSAAPASAGYVDLQNGGIFWSWAVVGNADGYRLLRFSDDPANPMNYNFYVDVPVTPENENSFTDTAPGLWTSGSTVTPTTIDGTPNYLSALSRWEDLTGNARHLLQATGARQPLWIPNQLNGFPSVRFDGVDDRMQVGSTFSAQGDFTFIAVLRCEAVTRGLVNLGSPYSYRSGSAFALAQGTSFETPPGMPVSMVVLTCVRAGANATIRINGVSQGSGVIGAGTWNSLGLLTNFIDTGGSLVDWFALDLWNSARTLAQIDTTEAGFFADYINAKSAAGADYDRITPEGDNRITPTGDQRITS